MDIKIKLGITVFVLIMYCGGAFAQQDTLPKLDTLPGKDSIFKADTLSSDSLLQPVKPVIMDSVLRITNLNPYITLHVDSTLSYKLDINKEPHDYYWFLRNAPVGLKINKDDGILTFKAEKSFFLSGRLKYDNEYKVSLGVQNLKNAKERVDTFFTLVFYSTEILPSRVKPTISNVLFVDEGDTVNFKVQCEAGSFPIENISTITNITLKNLQSVKKCDDEFNWAIPFDFIRDGDTAKQRLLVVNFIGSNKFFIRDTATVRIFVRDALNYPQRKEEYNRTVKDIKYYILKMKFSFKELDKKVKKTKNSRTSFDLASGTSALGGTVFSSIQNNGSNTVGKILPSVGVALVPVKEAVSPVKSYEQNSASLVRASIRRLEYTLSDNSLTGDRDAEILIKTKRLKDELKQIQVQLIDIPTMDTGNLSEEELNNYFNNPKVNRKYKVTKN
ncbi:MAG: hypothetical protein ABIN89_29150 [Chitinophagaceae bacterium]